MAENRWKIVMPSSGVTVLIRTKLELVCLGAVVEKLKQVDFGRRWEPGRPERKKSNLGGTDTELTLEIQTTIHRGLLPEG